VILESILGSVFGGATRLVQEGLSIWDKRDERRHEAEMFNLQAKLQEQRATAEAALRQMDVAAAGVAGEVDLLKSAMADQSAQVAAAGGWVAGLSASVRPLVSYFLLLLYGVSKASNLYLMLGQEVPFATAAADLYTGFDQVLLSSVVTYWFADRSIRKASGT